MEEDDGENRTKLGATKWVWKMPRTPSSVISRRGDMSALWVPTSFEFSADCSDAGGAEIVPLD